LKDNNEYKKVIYPYNGKGEEGNCKVVGYIPADYENNSHIRAIVCDDDTFKRLTDGSDKIYNFAVGAMPQDSRELKNLVSYCYREDTNVRYQIQNAITFELDSVNEFLVEFAKIFVYIGLGFALFAALMLSNFIAMSISHKKQEIGILRAIGSRSNDVFRIFFSESFIIAMINFILSSVGVLVITKIINAIIRNELGVLITVLSFTPRQIILLLAVSIFVAFIASFFPVKKIASKKPIDSIRNR
jgi:ABC-type antimicrobial peptide transport system permease subunit